MLALVELLSELLERARQQGRHQWLLRLAMVGSALLALTVLWQLTPSPLLLVLAGLGVLLGLLLPRGHAPVVLAVVLVLWAAGAARAGGLAMVPVAIGLLGWHWAAAATSVGRGPTRVDRAVWRRLTVPLAVGVAAVGVGLALASLLGGLVLPPALTVTAVLVLVLVGVTGLVLWPTDRGPGSTDRQDRLS